MNYKKNLILFFALELMFMLYAGSAFCINTHVVVTKVNDEIEPDLRQKMLDLTHQFSTGLRNSDYEKVKEVLSPRLLNSNDFDINAFMNQVSEVMKNDFTIFNQYFSTIHFNIGNATNVKIIPSFSDEDMLMINGLKFFGSEAYNLFLKSNNKGWQVLLFIGLSKFENEWKINIINYSPYSINFLTAPKLYDMQKDAFENGRLTSCTIYSWAMDRLLKPAPYLKYIKEKEYRNLMELSRSDFNKTINFPFVISDMLFVGINVETTDNEGLIPVIYYVTRNNLDATSIEDEAMQVKDEIISKFYGIEKDFDYLVLRAFRELPSDPKRIYKNFAVVLDLK